VEDGYVGPLSLDMSMLRMGEPAPRTLSSPTANMQMDSTGFVQACLGPVTIHQVGMRDVEPLRSQSLHIRQ
jgi:hypothetical protein